MKQSLIGLPPKLEIEAGDRATEKQAEDESKQQAELAKRNLRVSELEAYVDKLEGLAAARDNPPLPERYADGLYQNGELVGTVSGVEIDGQEMRIGRVTGSEKWRTHLATWYQDHLVAVTSIDSATFVRRTMEGEERGIKERVKLLIIGDKYTIQRPN